MRKALLLVALMALVSPGSAFACRAVAGMHVTLFGGVDDPDVLVWDTKDRLIGYAGGSSDTRKFLLPHAILNRPGTRAIVVSCRGNVVRAKFRVGPEDAIGVLILSGKYRGRYGWVSSSDVHGRGIPETRDQW